MKRLRINIRLAHFWLALASGLVPASLASGQGTIIYHQPSVPISPLIGQQLDFDGDGQAELRFYDASYLPGSYWATDASGVGSARLAVMPNLGFDGGSQLAPLSQGFLIGDSLSPVLLWASQNAPNNYGNALVLGSYIPETPEGGPIPVGLFYGTTAFIGIHFQIGSDWHYGWMRVRGGTAGVADDGRFYLNPPGWILDWAYESRPDTPIFAGAGIPEPSTWALLGIGLMALCFARRRRSS